MSVKTVKRWFYWLIPDHWFKDCNHPWCVKEVKQ